jgi:hypothetical protein
MVDDEVGGRGTTYHPDFPQICHPAGKRQTKPARPPANVVMIIIIIIIIITVLRIEEARAPTVCLGSTVPTSAITLTLTHSSYSAVQYSTVLLGIQVCRYIWAGCGWFTRAHGNTTRKMCRRRVVLLLLTLHTPHYTLHILHYTRWQVTRSSTHYSEHVSQASIRARIVVTGIKDVWSR